MAACAAQQMYTILNLMPNKIDTGVAKRPPKGIKLSRTDKKRYQKVCKQTLKMV